MKIPLQVTFRSTPRSGAVEAHIREKADKLDMFYDRIMGCRVVVAAPHRRHHKARAYAMTGDFLETDPLCAYEPRQGNSLWHNEASAL